MTSAEFSKEIEQLQPYLKNAAIKLTTNREDANDLTQDVAMKAFRNRDKFKDGTNFKAWLHTIMRNTFLTNCQKQAKKNTFIDSTDNMFYIDSKSEKNDVFRQVDKSNLYNIVKSLEKIYKVPFQMYYNGYKYYEISDILSVPIGTVKNRIHIARKLLKQKWHSIATYKT